MNSTRWRRARASAIALATGSLIVSGCSSGSHADDGAKAPGLADAKSAAKPVTFGSKADSKGPAKSVSGAHKGGTMNVYQENDFSHLDPAQIYVSDAKQLASLIHRGLTTFKEDSKGHTKVVGDLADSAGEKSDGGKTWTYHLKDGIKDQHGHRITSDDIRHSIERTYANFITDGPIYIQNWLSGLDYRKKLKGGDFKGRHLPDSVLDTPDKKTVKFHFKQAQADLPQALTMPGYAVVPKKDDTKEKYDQKPTALGPYKIKSFAAGKSMKLVRNKEWDPKTDPKRHQYVDGFNIAFNHDLEDQAERLISNKGGAKNGVTFSGQLSGSKIPKAMKQASKRMIQGYQPYVWQLNMNMYRIKKKKVRDAITYAMPNAQLLRPDGGKFGGSPAGGLMAPTLPGFEKGYDPYGKTKHPNGEPKKAKKLVKQTHSKGKKLVLAYANTDRRQKQAVIIADALDRAGFDVQKKEIDNATWYEQMGKVHNKYDIYLTGWGQDWPSPNTVFPPSYDGDKIADGASNYSHVDDKHVNKEMDRIQKIQDPQKSAKEWQKLHHYLMEKVNPAVPLYYTKTLQVHGSNVGGARYSLDQSYADPTRLYLKK